MRVFRCFLHLIAVLICCLFTFTTAFAADTSCADGYHYVAGLADVDTSINATGYAAIGNDGNKNYTYGGKTQSDYNLTANGTWGTSFSYGDITGKALCSTTNKTGSGNYPTGTPDESGSGLYCWCQIDGFTPKGETKQSLSGAWVFKGGNSSADKCAYSCAYDCALLLRGNFDFRAALLGSVGASPAICEANTYTVSFNSNNGTGGQTSAVTATYNANMPLISTTAPTRTGYTFAGWYDATTGGTQYYTAAGASARTWNKTSNATLYAQWTANTITCPAGTYLPANTTQCTECPTNSYCAGGTNSYSETDPQGIEQCPVETFSAPGTSSISECMEPKFTATYSGTEAGFRMTAGGTFYIDWGDGTVQKIVRNVTGYTDYYHTYSQSGSYNVRFAGQATGYSTTTQTTENYMKYNDIAIAFDTSITSISGSLGSIFSTIGDGGTLATQPRFAVTFAHCTNLTGSIPAELFTGVHGQPVPYMFAATFWDTKLSGNIPPLFKDLSGVPVERMFFSTFYDLTGLTGSIPSNLFGNLSGNPAKGMFDATFYGCSGLTGSIPANLFSGIEGAPAESMFDYTFYGCSGLTGYIPHDLFAGISGAPASNMFSSTFGGCSGLTGFKDSDGNITNYIPNDYMSKINSTNYASGPMSGMFSGTGILSSCPENMYRYETPFDSDFYGTSGKVSCASCPDGTISPAGSTSIEQCVVPTADIIYNYVNGGSGCNNDTYTPGSAKELTCVPSKAGYTFAGWYDSATGGNKITQITALDTGDKTFYAKWTANTITCPAGTYLPANTTQCTECPTNSYCAGGTNSYSETDPQGIEQCPTGYTLSEGGATSEAECYRQCSASDVPHLKSGGTITGMFYSNNTNACEPANDASCENGYHYKEEQAGLNIDTSTKPTWIRYKSINGTGSNSSDTTGLNNGDWDATFSYGDITGKALCSTTNKTGSGNYPTGTPDESGNGQYCWCQIDGYTPTNGSKQSLSGAWVFYDDDDSADYCADDCAHDCANGLLKVRDFRAALLGSVPASPAICEANVYTITYKDGNTVLTDTGNPANYTYGVAANINKNLTKDGYTFAGWYDASTGGNKITQITALDTGDKTLTAQWSPIEYTIIYELNGGTNYANAPTTYTIESAISLNTPTRSGYTFNGWIDDNNNPITSISTGSIGNKTLSAQWTIAECQSGYELRTVPGAGLDLDSAILASSSSGNTAENTWTATVSGTSLSGISSCAANSTTSNASGDILSEPINTENASDNLYCYCKLSEPAESSWVLAWKYSKATGTSGCPVKCANQCAYLMKNRSDSGGRSTTYFREALYSTASTSEQTVCEPISYTITYDLGGGINNSGNPASYTINSATITLSDPTKDGYTFNGWIDGNGNTITDIPTGSTGNITLTAQWSPIEYTITYELNGGTNYANAPTSYTIESTTITLNTPTKTGYIFDSWVDDNDNTITEIPTGSAGDIILTARWKELECQSGYEVHIIPGTGLDLDSSILASSSSGNNSANTWTAIVSGTSLSGISSCAANSTRTIDYNYATSVSGDILNEPINTENTSDNLYCYCKLIEPEESSWVFAWRYSSATGTSGCSAKCANQCAYLMKNKNDSSGERSTAYFRESLYSTTNRQTTCDPISYTITYELNGGTNNSANPASYTIDSAIILNAPTKDGYTFNGWYTTSDFSGSALLRIPTGSTGNKKLYAQWTANTITCPAGTYLPANTTQCTECPINSYCAGGTNSYSETDPQGIEQCPTGYSLSEGGATSADDCYRQCSASDVPHLKSGGTITGMYYSNNTNACEPANDASCADGYYYAARNPLANVNINIGGTGYAAICHDGNQGYTADGKTQSDYGLTANGTWGASFRYGDITGKALCSTKPGDNQNYTWTNPTTFDSLTDETGTGQNCYCQIDGFTPAGGSKQALSGPWMFDDIIGSPDICASTCSFNCVIRLHGFRAFSVALLGTVSATVASCEAYTYTITYNLDGGTNNSANPTSYTIETAITLSEPTKDSYTFNGWVDGNGNTITSIPLGSTGNITLTAQWTPAVIHCDAGYYLPANSTTCQPCETKGTYCDAGNYDVKNQDQGILNCPIPDNITGAFIINYNESHDLNDNGVYDSAEECVILLMQTEYEDFWGQDAMAGYDTDNEFNQNIAQWYIYCKYDLGTNSYKCIPSTAYQIVCTGGYYIPETTLITNSTECDFNFDSLPDSTNNKKCYNIDLANMTNPCIPAQPGYYTTGYDKIYTDELDPDELDSTELYILNKIHGFGGAVLGNEYFDWFANKPAPLDEQYAKCPQEYPNSDAGAWTINMCYRTCPSKDGYTLVSEDREYYNETNKCEYVANTYTITYELNGGSGCANETYTLGTAKELSCVPTRTGYTFNGWYDAATGGNKITQITALDIGDKTFYAQWSIAVVHCDAGYYLPANSTECRICSENHYCDGGDYIISTEYDAGIELCPDGTTSPEGASGADGCGKLLHVGDNIIYLTTVQETTPALAVRLEDKVYYARTTPVSEGAKPMNKDTTESLRVRIDGIEYSIHDNTIKGEQ